MADPRGAAAHPDVRFETADVPYNLVMVILAVLAALIAVTMVAMWFTMDVLRAQTRTTSQLPMAALVREELEQQRKALAARAEQAERDGELFKAMELRRQEAALRRYPAEPRLEGIDVVPDENFENKIRSGTMGWPSMARERRANDDEILGSAGYDPKTKEAHIPIERAMELVKDKLKQQETVPSRH